MSLGINLANARTIAQSAILKARDLNMQPISVTVVNAAGQTKVQLCEDESSLMRNDISFAKAWGCIGMGHPTRGQAAFAKQMPDLYQVFVQISEARLVPAPGGVIIRRQGQVIGAVGVSGDRPDMDEQCALAGIAAVEDLEAFSGE